ncbi:13298_t:CDS:2, partial [Cetraspora pellucida]
LISGQNKRLAAFGKDSKKKLSELIIHHRLVSENEQPILIKLDAIVRACDESLLSQDGYCRLATAESELT